MRCLQRVIQRRIDNYRTGSLTAITVLYRYQMITLTQARKAMRYTIGCWRYQIARSYLHSVITITIGNAYFYLSLLVIRITIRSFKRKAYCLLRWYICYAHSNR